MLGRSCIDFDKYSVAIRSGDFKTCNEITQKYDDLVLCLKEAMRVTGADGTLIIGIDDVEIWADKARSALKELGVTDV